MIKINDDSTIAAYIPDGWELDKEKEYILDLDIDDTGLIFFNIKKKKTIKDFEWYVKNYLKTSYFLGFATSEVKINYWISDENLIDLQINFLEMDGKGIPVEFQIGLLKHICYDMKLNFSKIIRQIQSDTLILKHEELFNLLPEYLINTIIEL